MKQKYNEDVLNCSDSEAEDGGKTDAQGKEQQTEMEPEDRSGPGAEEQTGVEISSIPEEPTETSQVVLPS